jgi:hypothetical protein
MNLILFAIIALQLGYLVYSDIFNRKERESLERKIMSEDLDEYLSSMEEDQESVKEEPDPYISMDEAGIERVLKAKEK